MRRREYATMLLTGGLGAIAGCSEEESTGRQQGTGDDGADDGGPDSGSSDEADGDGAGNDTSGDGDSSDGGDESASGMGDAPVAILEHEWYNEGEFDAGVRGQVENRSGESQDYVVVEVYFIDADGVQFDDGLDNTTDLADGRVWEFDVMFFGDNPDRVESYEVEASTSAL